MGVHGGERLAQVRVRQAAQEAAGLFLAQQRHAQQADQHDLAARAQCGGFFEQQAEQPHPQDALGRARHRGWMEFGSAVLNAIAAF